MIDLSEQAAEGWAERARREGHATAGDAVRFWAEQEGACDEPLDPAEVELLRERIAADPATDIPFEEGIRRIAAKHGLTLRPRGNAE